MNAAKTPSRKKKTVTMANMPKEECAGSPEMACLISCRHITTNNNITTSNIPTKMRHNVPQKP